MKDNFASRGFETISADALGEYRAEGVHLRHRQTGAEVYSVRADDPENLFSFAFRTPPTDHTGAAHILEHSVLCGSERYPLKDPFLVLLKGSAHTFLNAMTYPDKTVYPAASTVRADFINLLRVYGDAVFFPHLKREVFEQEGHRLEIVGNDSLRRSGIVLNEMKGSYSSPESVAGDVSLRGIFPESPYNWDSGGDPQHIPELTYDALREFHARHYHPSNARIFLYGDHDLDQVLDILDQEFLGRFEKRVIDSEIPLQEPWDAPRRTSASWPSAQGEPAERKSTIGLNWLWGLSTDPDASLSSRVLSVILLGHGGSPLQKGIIDSGLGEDLSPVSGLETDTRQMVFSAALRGTDSDKTEEFESLVLDILKTCADGLNPELVEGALRTVEFQAREIRGGSPFGMRLMKRALKGWLHGRPPLESLEFDVPMARLRNRVLPGFFEEQIRRNLLENPHRLTVVVSPDPELQASRDRQERAELRQLRKSMNISGLEALEQSAERLASFQNDPDTSEDLASIPFLSRTDLPAEVIKIAAESGNRGPVRWYRHDTFTNGVSYLALAFDLQGLDPKLQSWVPLFGRALTDVGLPGRSHEEVARELALKTGGLGCYLEASPIHLRSGGGISLRLFVQLKALTGQWNQALDITRELLTSANFADEGRVWDLLVEMRNDYRAAVLPSGSAYASLRASAKHSASAPWEELWYGVNQLQFLQAAAERPDGAAEAAGALSAIRDAAVQKNRLALAVTSDPGAAPEILKTSLSMADALPDLESEERAEPGLFRHNSRGEALSAAAAVSYAALSLPAPVLGTPEQARGALLAHILRTGFLWERIRMKGGAYGASASMSGLEGTFTFSTYRDPHINPSLKAFRDSLEWAAEHMDDETVNLGVIGTVGRELRPLGPGERGITVLKRNLYGIADDLRQTRREIQLSADAQSLRKTAQELLEAWDYRSISVIGGADALEEACLANPELAEVRIVLPS